jgi:hypothetical protein
MPSAPQVRRQLGAGAAAIAISLVAVAGSSPLTSQRAPTADPQAIARAEPGTAPWVRVPRDQVAALCGLDPSLLEIADQTLAATPYVVVRYGRLCWEHGATEEQYAVMSITKTMGSLLFGITSTRRPGLRTFCR